MSSLVCFVELAVDTCAGRYPWIGVCYWMTGKVQVHGPQPSLGSAASGGHRNRLELKKIVQVWGEIKPVGVLFFD